LGSLLFCSFLPVTAEIRPFDIVMQPSEGDIHYTGGYIRGPGSIDLSDLTFEAISEAFVSQGDDFVDGDDNMGDPPRHERHLMPTERMLDGGIETESFMVDIAVFQMSDACAKNKDCDLTQFGVGGRTEDGNLRWCCSEDAIDFGLCPEDRLGRLIMHEDLLKGQTGSISIPFAGNSKKRLRNGEFELEESSRYVVVFSNCNGDGRDIRVTGHLIWHSTHGYLPGELYGFMYFYILLTIVYAVLMCWFGLLMQANKESRIPIEKWIFMTIIMGSCEMFFRSSDYFLWNVRGTRPTLLLYGFIIVGVLKRGVSRALLVMVSLGWGVIKDSLGSTMNSIVVLAAAFTGVSAFRDLMMVFAEEDMTTLSDDQEHELFDIVTILTFIVAAIDVIFILWILDALNGTMQYLENNSQLRKLARYLRLRTILLCAILFATIWVVFSLVNSYNKDAIVREEDQWIVDGATKVNYLFVLIGICILWRPNPSAREYAYVMELPASGGEDGETELELSAAVPSAMDDDDDDFPAEKFDDENGEHDHRFKIDEGEAS